jgi:hypothetical protein
MNEPINPTVRLLVAVYWYTFHTQYLIPSSLIMETKIVLGAGTLAFLQAIERLLNPAQACRGNFVWKRLQLAVGSPARKHLHKDAADIPYIKTYTISEI